MKFARRVPVAVVLVLATCTPAHAASLWLHGKSWHASDAAPKDVDGRDGYNETNPGLGVQFDLGDGHATEIGAYENSYYRTTVYATYMRTWSMGGGFRLGGFVGGFTGYNDSIAPAAAAIVRYRRARLIVSPAGAALSVRLFDW